MNPTSYATSLLAKIGFNPQKDTARLAPDPDMLYEPQFLPRMWEDEFGNLCCSVVDLNGDFITNGIATKAKDDRSIAHVRIQSDSKSADDKQIIIGGINPFIYKNTLALFKRKAAIEVLVICVGPLDSYYLDKCGIPVIGIPNLITWKKKTSQHVFDLIKEFCAECTIEKLLWLTDGRTAKVKWADNKDLSEHAYKIVTSINLFKDLMQYLCVGNQFWAFIKDKVHVSAYDLLIANNAKKKQILQTLVFPETANEEYFSFTNVTRHSLERVREILGINGWQEAIVENFYKKYEDEIGLKTFVFGRGVYEYNQVEKEVQYIRAGEAQQFVHIGSNVYIKGPITTDHGELENVLKLVDKEFFNNKFKGRGPKELKKIWLDIPFYDDQCNEPNHLNYQQSFVVTNEASGFTLEYYNKYNQLSWVPKPGPCPLSIQFIQHIFGFEEKVYKGKKYISWELGMDYEKVLYCDPTHKLPIVCPVSKEGDTGKSKYCEWHEAIYQGNAQQVQADELLGRFSGYWANALFLYVDEAFITKQEIFERIKSLVTSNKGKDEVKFGHSGKTKNNIHFVIASNNVDAFLRIRSEEGRPWILKVPTIPEDKRDLYFFDKLRAEIPHFLYYLINRPYHCERHTRIWFPYELIDTDALHGLKKASRTQAETILEMAIIPYIQNCKQTVVELSPGDIQELLKTELKDNKFSAVNISDAMKNKDIEITKFSNPYVFYESVNLRNDSEWTIVERKKKSRFYRICADQFLEPDELMDLFKNQPQSLAELEGLAKEQKRRTWFEILKENPGRYGIRENLEQLLNAKNYLTYHASLPAAKVIKQQSIII